MEPQPTPPPPAMSYGQSEPPNALGGVWLCCGLGLLILFIFPRTLQWLLHATLGTHFDPIIDLSSGTEVPYPKSYFFWSDLGSTTLGLMLIVEGLSFLVVRRRGLLWVAAGCVGVLTLYNLGYAIASFSQSLALMSAVAVLIGVPATVDLVKRAKRAHSFRVIREI